MKIVGLILSGNNFDGIVRIQNDGSITLTLETMSGSAPMGKIGAKRLIEFLDSNYNPTDAEIKKAEELLALIAKT